MGTVENGVSFYYEEDEETVDFYEFETLPTVLEDEENVSLADILSLRDRCLTEQDIWAVCLECCFSMKSISHSSLFQTLCVTPDTLAFNTNGNVCFMEQLSDDPEGAFVAPEFDITGNTLKAHIYSLGLTLKVASEYVIEPEVKPEISQDLTNLLEQMQQENPEHRPDTESIISLCEEKLQCIVPASICRNLSAIGRRVLSIESVSAFKGKLSGGTGDLKTREGSCPYRIQTRNRSRGAPGWSTEDLASDPNLLNKNNTKSIQIKHSEEKCNEGKKETAPNEVVFDLKPNDTICTSPPTPMKNSLSKERKLQKLPAKTYDNSTSKVEPARQTIKAPSSFPLLSESNQESVLVLGTNKFFNGTNNKSFNGLSQHKMSHLPCSFAKDLKINSCGVISNTNILSTRNPRNYKRECSLPESLICFKKYKSYGVVKDIPTNQWISLKDLLSRYGRPFKDYDLWALCHQCLYTLQTYTDFPVYLCMETVYIAFNGEVLFVNLQDTEVCSSFYLAPEFEENGIITEKVCVYGIAAVLWTTAKANLPSNHKLVLPRTLKRLLLDMAKKNPDERPSIENALKTCNNYLLEQGIDSKDVWTEIINITYQEFECNFRSDNLFFICLRQYKVSYIQRKFAGFMPTGKSKLTAVKGPVPFEYSLNKKSNLPNAFTSSATHFKPIILVQNLETKSPHLHAVMRGFLPLCFNPGPLHVSFISPTESSNVSLTEHTPTIPTTTSVDHTNSNNAKTSFLATSSSSVIPRSSLASSFLMRQDPKTGVLTLVPVQVAMPEELADSRSSNAANVSLPSYSACAQNTDSLKSLTQKSETKGETKTEMKNSRAAISNSHLTQKMTSQEIQTKISSSSSPQKRSVPSLTRVVHLIQEEFAFDGYLETGVEHLTMVKGEYILSLKGLKFHTFCGAVSEKFCDLYWDEKLLEKLYEELNGKLPPYTLLRNKLNTEANGQSLPKACYLEITVHISPSMILVLNVPIGLWGKEVMKSKLSISRKQKKVKDICDISKQPPPLTPPTQESHLKASTEEYVQSCQDSAEESEETDDCVDYTEGRCTMSPLQAKVRRCSPGWRSAFYGAEFFNQEVLNYVKTLGRQRNNEPHIIKVELNQQLLIETKNYKKTIVFYQKLLHKEKRKKGSEAKVTLPKVKAQLEEMKRDVQFLELVKSYLEILHVEQWGLECSLLPSLVNTTSKLEMLELKPSDVSNLLIFHSSKEGERSNHSKSNQLQAGTSTGLMSYLYSSQAVLEGYVQQFLYTFRYFCTPEELLQFLIDRFNSASSSVNQGASSNCVKVYNRTLDLMQAWVEDCHHIDFAKMPELQDKIEEFILNKVIPQDSRGEHILLLLHDEPKGKCTFAFPCCSFNLESIKNDDDTKSLHSLCKQLSEEDVIRKSFNWKIYRGSESTTPRQKDRQYTIAAALPKPCYTSFLEELPGSSISIDEKGSSFLIEYHTHHISQQLTLLQQEEFQKCHPVHFLNSRALGVNDKAISTAKVSSMDGLPAEGSSVFVPSYKQDQYLLQLLRYADNVSNWISAEIVTCGTSKFQVNLLSKFLLISKSCYEMRNFATAMQILGGLENVIVRQLPAWKNLPSKVLHILEELKAVQMFLKSDNLCLMEGDRFKRLPTIPCAHLLAMHIQQLEIGAFTMANGAYKWSKLRNIAKVASQIHAFQENLFTFVPDPALQSYLRQRINHFSQADIPVLAAENNANFCQVPGVKESRKFQDTLRRIKTTFQ
uniref:Kinase non-catalytic C-lobe domain containing 1 n=1 Tax=Latimeria chalumnae TaxID=7897 RepID=H3APL9_LATCH